MALSKNEKTALWVSAAIGVVVLIWLMIMRRQPQTSEPSSNSPGGIGQAYPGGQPWLISGNGLPTVPVQSGGCNGCNQSGGMFTSIGNMIQYFTSQSKNIFDKYQANVYAAYPDSVTQYFNNPVGAAQSVNARAVMG